MSAFRAFAQSLVGLARQWLSRGRSSPVAAIVVDHDAQRAHQVCREAGLVLGTAEYADKFSRVQNRVRLYREKAEAKRAGKSSVASVGSLS